MLFYRLMVQIELNEQKQFQSDINLNAITKSSQLTMSFTI